MKLFIRESNIGESAQDELYRIAEYELLPETQLYKISERCTIDEDTFDFTQTGTVWGGYICYDIYMEWTAEYLPKIERFYRNFTRDDDIDFPLNVGYDGKMKLDEFKIYFNIHVDGERVTVDIADIEVPRPKDLERVFDLDALCDAIKEIAENAANYIHSKIGGYYEYDDMDESSCRTKIHKTKIRESDLNTTIRNAVGDLTKGIDFKRTDIGQIKRVIKNRLDDLVSDIVSEYNVPEETARKLTKSVEASLNDFIGNMTSLRNKYSSSVSSKGTGLKTTLQSFYTSAFPSDDLGLDIDSRATFEDLLFALDDGDVNKVYALCANDSIVRERLFTELANILNVDYDVIYDKFVG